MGAVRLARRIATFVAVAAAARAVAPAAELPATPIAEGVVVGGVEVGGLTSVPARAAVREALGQPVVLVHGKRRLELDPAAFARFGVDAAVRDALGALPSRHVGVEVTVDDARLRAYVRRLALKVDRPAHDAKLVGLSRRLRPVITPARPGRRLEQAVLREAIDTALRTGVREEIAVTIRRVEPKVKALGAIVVIARESNRLQLFHGSTLVRTFRVATGTSRYPTPLGRFTIADKQYNPWWYPPPSDWARGLEPVPPGPGNPLGTRWMGLSIGGVGIHGTPDAASIGYSASHGCIRMHVWEAEWLFEQVALGTPVFIVSA